MDTTTKLLVIAIGLLSSFLVLNALRRKRLEERYALMWLVAALAILLVPFLIPVTDRVLFAIGLEYPPAFMFLLAFLWLVFVCFSLTVSLSRVNEQNKRLLQEVALLRNRIEGLEKHSDRG